MKILRFQLTYCLTAKAGSSMWMQFFWVYFHNFFQLHFKKLFKGNDKTARRMEESLARTGTSDRAKVLPTE